MNLNSGKPRFSVHRSNMKLYVQIIDDVAGKTLAAGSTGKGIAKAREFGKEMAAKAQKAGVKAVIFDRGRYAYHGRVKALAEGAREGGLKF
jgi:large subunit ribosomal protein L18